MKKFVLLLIGVILIGTTPHLAKAIPWQVGNSVSISLLTSVNSDPANKWNDIGGYGGLFKVTDTTSNVSIETFCLELDEFISTGTTYYVADISDDWVWKGGRNTDSDDKISDSTKWLYVQYLDGIYTNTQALQLAIWVLEDEYYDKSDFKWDYWGTTPGSIGVVAKDYFDAAQGQSTTADIRALDLRDASGKPVQSYLIRVPEPSLLILLGIGLSAVGLAARRRIKIK